MTCTFMEFCCHVTNLTRRRATTVFVPIRIHKMCTKSLHTIHDISSVQKTQRSKLEKEAGIMTAVLLVFLRHSRQITRQCPEMCLYRLLNSIILHTLPQVIVLSPHVKLYNPELDLALLNSLRIGLNTQDLAQLDLRVLSVSGTGTVTRAITVYFGCTFRL
jgi:hypothetical protein